MSAVLKPGQRPYSREFQPMPAEVPALELVPLDPSKQGFSGRLPPVTEADHVAVGLAVGEARSGYISAPVWQIATAGAPS